MKLRSICLLLTGLTLLFLTSCSSKKSDVPVPEDASFVMHIDGASLNSKLSWDEIKQSELFKLAMEETKDSLGIKILNNPEESGLNIKSDAYIFMKNQGRGGYAAIICNLTDETKFETFIKQVIKDKTIEKKDDIAIINNEDNILTWKKDRLIIISNAPGTKKGFYDSEDSEVNFSSDSLIIFAKEIYELKKSKSIGNNSKFSSLLETKGDMHFWVNSSSLGGDALPAMLAITKAGMLFKDNISTGTVSFEDGKITLKAKNYLNKDLEAIYKKFSPKPVDEELLQKIPAGNIDAFFSFNYPPAGLKEFITTLGVDGLLNIFLAESNYSIDEFVNANKGDILLSVSDFKVESKEVKQAFGDGEEFTYKKEKPDAKVLFAASIKDKPAFEKLIALLTSTMKKEGSNEADKLNMPYVVTDKWFVAGSDSTTVHSFGNTATKHAFIDLVKGHPMSGYINIQNFINGAKGTMSKDTAAMLIAERSLQFWQDVVFYGGEFNNGGIESYAEINMVDKKTNSLKQLNQYIGFIAAKMKEEEKKRKERNSDWDVIDEPKEE